jgi:UPF0755 protein
MNDILPPKRPLNRAPIPPSVQKTSTSSLSDKTELSSITSPGPKDLQSAPSQIAKPRKAKKIILWVVGVILFAIIAAAGSFYVWYTQSLRPVNSSDQSRVQVEIPVGSSPSDIGQLLEGKKLIRSWQAFDIYTRLSGTRGSLQAGTYDLSPSNSTEVIVSHLASGKTDKLTVTFLPGATLADNRKVLLDAGYSTEEVDAALNKKYDHPLFQDKPENADLEGYIWGDTYTFGIGTKVEKILTTTFDHYYQVLSEESLTSAFKQHNLSLFQAITLASIIQREVPTAEDQNKVAQVFYSRLATDMVLGSDVTYQYAAKKLGVTPTPELNSPYNTRRFPGLPPGPIATPGKSALQAVAHPTEGTYLYFLSGDDDVTYFARTIEEHEANIQAHCHVKCATP